MACANVNCFQDYSLGEITVIMLCCIDGEVFSLQKVPYMAQLDTNWLILPRQTMTPCFRTHGSTITFNNIGLLAETFKVHFAKKSKFKTGGLEYH